jgi:hypothetical protein
VAACVRATPGIDHYTLVRATMNRLGILRMTDNIRSLVEATVVEAVQRGRIVLAGSGTYWIP